MAWEMKYQEWEGSAAKMADVTRGLARELDLGDDDILANERLIRNYARLGIVSRPERRGKEAVYGFRQIVEFLAARVLVNDGWPLAKIAEMSRHASLQELIDVLPKGEEMNTAQRLIRKFREPQSDGAVMARGTPPLTQQPMHNRTMSMVQRKRSLQDSLDALGNKGGTLKHQLTHRIELTPWCHVLVDASELRLMTGETSELLGIALNQALQEMRSRKGNEK